MNSDLQTTLEDSVLPVGESQVLTLTYRSIFKKIVSFGLPEIILQR